MQTTPSALSVRDVQRAALMHWFARNWRLPLPNETPHNVELVPRKRLRAQLNVLLAALQLPLLGERSALWTDWVLRDLLRLGADEARSGKPLRLVRLCSSDELRDTLRHLLTQLDQRAAPAVATFAVTTRS